MSWNMEKRGLCGGEKLEMRGGKGKLWRARNAQGSENGAGRQDLEGEVNRLRAA